MLDLVLRPLWPVLNSGVGAWALDAACVVEAGIADEQAAEGQESHLAKAARENAPFKGMVTGAWHALAAKDGVKLYVRGADVFAALSALCDTRMNGLETFGPLAASYSARGAERALNERRRR